MSIKIDVEIYAGTRAEDAARELVALAKRIGITVWADFNDKRVLARPEDDPDMLAARLTEAIGTPGSPEYVTTN